MKPGILTSLLRQYQYRTAPRCYFYCNWKVNTQRQRQRQPAEYTQMQTTKQKLSNSEKTQGKQMCRAFGGWEALGHSQHPRDPIRVCVCVANFQLR